MALDRTTARQLSLRVGHGSGYEALFSLSIALGEVPADRYVGGVELRGRFGRLPAAIRNLISTVDSGFGFNWSDLIGLVGQIGSPVTLPRVTELLSGIAPVDLKLAMLGYHVVEFRRLIGEDLFHQAAMALPAAAKAFRRTAIRSGREVGPLVDLPPQTVADRTVKILMGLPTAFYLPSPNSDALLAEAAEKAAKLSSRLTPAAVVERVTRGVVFVGEPGVSELLVIPNLISRPWSLILEHEGTKIFSYPVIEPAGADRPDSDLVEVYRALGDETRLRLLKRLRLGHATFGQLGRELGLAKSTVHHHAVILRTAGFVRVRLGRSSGLELSPQLPGLDRLLRQYLDT